MRVAQTKNELRGLIQARNQLAAYASLRSDPVSGKVHAVTADKNDEDESVDNIDETLTRLSILPPPIDDERTCKRCYVVDACMLYRKVSHFEHV